MTTQTQIFELIKLVTDNKLPTLLNVVKLFITSDLDDFFTADDLAAHEAAMKEYENGELIPFGDIHWKE